MPAQITNFLFIGDFGWSTARWCHRGMDLLHDIDEGRDSDSCGGLCLCATGSAQTRKPHPHRLHQNLIQGYFWDRTGQIGHLPYWKTMERWKVSKNKRLWIFFRSDRLFHLFIFLLLAGKFWICIFISLLVEETLPLVIITTDPMKHSMNLQENSFRMR